MERKESNSGQNNLDQSNLQLNNKLKETLRGILLGLQEEFENKGKNLTIESAMEALTQYMSVQGRTKEMLTSLLGKFGQESVSINELGSLSIDAYGMSTDSRLQELLVDHLDDTYKWVLLSAEINHFSTIATKWVATQTSGKKDGIPTFHDYLEDAQFPIVSNGVTLQWNSIYFKKLASLQNEYISKYGDKSLHLLLKKEQLTINTIITHGQAIGLLPENFQETTVFLEGGTDGKNDSFAQALLETHLLQTAPEVWNELKQHENDIVDYFSAKSGKISGLLLEEYPFSEFLDQGPKSIAVQQSQAERNKEGVYKTIEREYYTRISQQAKKQGKDNFALLAQASISLLVDKKKLNEKSIEQLSQSIMDALYQKKMSTFDTIMRPNFISALSAIRPKPSQEHIEQQLDGYKAFWKSWFDLSVREHTLIDQGSGENLTITAQKNLRFLPNKLSSAESLEELFDLHTSIIPTGTEESNYIFAAGLARENLWSSRPISTHTSFDHELYLQKNQLYKLYLNNGKTVSGYVEIVPVEEGGKSAFMLALIDPNNPRKKSYPLGKKGKYSFEQLIEGVKFDPIDKSGSVVMPRFDLRHNLSTGSGFSQFHTTLDQSLLMIHHQHLNNIAKFEEKNTYKKPLYTMPAGASILNSYAEQYKQKESQERIAKKYLSMKLVKNDAVPDYLRDASQNDSIDAWVDQGVIMINGDFFFEKYGVDLFDESLGLLDSEGFLDMSAFNVRVSELALDPAGLSSPEKIADDKSRRAMLLEIRKLQVHEKAHRIFHIYGLVDRPFDSMKGALEVHSIDNHSRKLLLSNEMLCSIAEGRLYTTQTDPAIRDRVIFSYPFVQVEQNGILVDAVVIEQDGKTYTVSIPHIEEQIRGFHPDLSTFSFRAVQQVDATMLGSLADQGVLDSSFEGLLKASASREPEAQITRAYAQDPANSNKLFLYPDNIADAAQPAGSRSAAGNQGVAGQLAGEPNALGVPLGIDATTPFTFPLNPQATNAIQQAITAIQQADQAGTEVVLPVDAQGNSVLTQSIGPGNQNLLNYLNGLLTGVSPLLGSTPPPNNQNNPQNNVNNPQTGTRTADQAREDTAEMGRRIEEQSRGAFDNAYKLFPGDSGVGQNGPEEGDILFLKDTISTRPGAASDWVQVTIDSVTQSEIVIKVTGHTEKDPAGVLNSEYPIPRNEQGIEMLRSYAQGSIYKYAQVGSKSDFLSYVQDDGKGNLGKGWEEVSPDMTKQYMHEGSSKLGSVTHVAVLPAQVAPFDLSTAVYEVEWLGDSVRLTGLIDIESDEDGNVTKQEKIITTMDYTSFVHFCKDKKLQPYTEEEINKSGKFQGIDNAEKLGKPETNSRKDMFVSVNGFIKMIKKFPETFKVKFEQEEKLQVTELFNRTLRGISSTFDDVLFIGDMKDDALSENDSTIMNIIQDYKSRLTHSSGDAKGSHANVGTEIIERQIFKKRMNSRADRLKACGYLLYVLEEGGHAYARKLQSYHGTGAWINAILGPEFRDSYLKERQHYLDLYESGGVKNDELQDMLAKLELKYIVENTTDHPLFGSRFGREVEGHMDKRGKIDAIDGVKSGVGSKGNIYDIYSAFKGAGISAMLPHVFLGSILAMEEKVDTEEHYKMFYQTIVIAITTGYTKQFSLDYMNKFKGICRRRGIPIGMFVSDPGSITKSVGVIDYIARSSGIQPGLYETINKRTNGKRDPSDPKLPGRDSLHGENFNEGGLAKKVSKIVEDWRGAHGGVMIDAFNYKSSYLINGLVDTNDPNAGYVREYFGDQILFNDYRDYKDTKSTEMGTGQNPFYNGIFNLDPGTFESYMLNYRGRYFNSNQSGEMWDNFSSSVDNISKILENASPIGREPLLRLLLKKWKMYFGKNLGDDGISIMSKFLQGSDRGEAEEQLTRLLGVSFYNNNGLEIDPEGLRVVEKRNQNYANESFGAPPVVKSTMGKYMKLLIDGFYSLTSNETKSKLVKDAFGK